MHDFCRSVVLPTRRTGWGLGSLLLAGVASLALSAPAEALTINATFGVGVTAQAQTAFNSAAAEFQTLYSDPINVNISVAAGSTGLGGSSTTVLGPLTYAQARSALITDNTLHPSADGTTSVSAGGSVFNTTDPTPAGSAFFVSKAQGKALGLISNDLTTDGTFTYNSTLQYTYNHTAAAGKFDFIGVAEHEISEIMGRIPGLGENIFGQADYDPYDLFRYTSAGNRGLTNGSGIYFSINNGTTNLHGYNFPNGNLSDPQDWDASNPADSYNAFLSTNQATMITSSDITALDVIGYDRAAVPAPLIGHGLPIVLAVGGLLFGARLWERNKKSCVDGLKSLSPTT